MAVVDCISHYSLQTYSLQTINGPACYDEDPLRRLSDISESVQLFFEREDELRLPLENALENGRKHVRSDTKEDGDEKKTLFHSLENSSEGTASSVKELIESLSTTNCIAIREKSSLSQVVSSCDAFMREHLHKMLCEKDLLSLPRVQVNVDVSDHHTEAAWSSDTFVLELVVPAVMKELIKFSSSQFVEEGVVNMELMSDLSVEMAGSDSRSKKDLSPEKQYLQLARKHCSPVGRLQLGQDLNGSIFRTEINSWDIIATYNLSGFAAVCLIHHPRGLMVLNINMVSKNVICPISPTTGIPYDVGITLISQMAQARSGFGLIPLGDSLMSVGGFNRSGVLSNTEIFSPGANLWVPNSKLSTRRARFSIVSVKDSIYAIGGSDGKSELGSIEKFSLSDKTWKAIPSKLSTARSNFGAVEMEGKIYAVGGTNYSRPLRTVEVFDPDDQKWKQIAPMSTPRNGVSVVSCNGKIYAIGGQTSSWKCLNSVECYDPSSSKWEEVAPMTMPRRNASTVTVEDRIYVIGGYNGSSSVNCVEVYSPISGKWSRSNPMALKRSSAAAVYLEGTIYVAGGFTGSIFLNSVEKFDVESEQWTSYIQS